VVLLRANETINSLAEIDLKEHWQQGKRGIILDLDNTITPWQQDALTEEALNFIARARTINYKIHILSNASYQRTKKVAERLAVGFTAPGFKPILRGYCRALRELSISASQVIVIGDQIFTDILGGNRAGCYTILVAPLAKREFAGTKIMRFLERLICGRICL